LRVESFPPQFKQLNIEYSIYIFTSYCQGWSQSRFQCFKPLQCGVIHTIAPSNQDIRRLWIGTDDGMIHVTSDGSLTRKDVTPSGIGPWAKVSLIDAGRFSPLVISG